MAKLIPAFILAFIESEIRHLEQVFNVGNAFAVQRNTDAGVNRDGVSLKIIRLADFFDNGGGSRASHILVWNVFRHESKLVASQTGEHISWL